MSKNRHGLSRHIPRDIALQVRQECFFGCVICGAMPTEYEHFNPEFKDAETHESSGIALLCTGHHADRTAGRISVGQVAKHRANPFNKNNAAVWRTALGPGHVKFNFGGNTFTGTSAGVSINGSPVLRVAMPQGGGLWHLAGTFVARGKEFLRFEENVVSAHSGSWDVQLVGTRLSVKTKDGEEVATVAELFFDAESNEVRLDRLLMGLKDGNRLDLSPGGVSLFDRNGNEFLSLGGNTVSGSGQGAIIIGDFQKGGATDTVSINIPQLGEYDDWVVR